MSITFGIYDFFSYSIPGFLYIFVINQFLAVLRLPHLNVNNFHLNIGYALVAVVVAYIVGGLMDPFAYIWYSLFYRKNIQQQSLDNLKKNYPGLKVDYDVKDGRILFSFLKHDHLELANNIEQMKALNLCITTSA